MGKGVLAALTVAVCLLCFSACGGTSDSYVGSWKRVDTQGSPGLVIAKTEKCYQLAFVGTTAVEGWTLLTRRGEKLVGWPDVTIPLAVNVEVVLVYDKGGQRLLYSDNSLRRLPYVKVSDVTSAPSPSD